MAHKITLNRPEEERLEILVDGESIGSFNHDEHGWGGMEAVERLATRMAKKLNIEIEETFEEND